MNTPTYLIAAALLFWGWGAGQLPLGAGLAALLLAACGGGGDGGAADAQPTAVDAATQTAAAGAIAVLPR